MKEKDLYNVIKGYLKDNGFYPVRKEPTIRIRGYKPDVTGLRGKEVQTVEAKKDFDDMSLMSAITQAKVYQLGSTHTYIAFPAHSWDDTNKEDLRSLARDLCDDFGIGIYIIDTKKRVVSEEKPARFNTGLNLKEYDSIIQQLEGTDWVSFENTKPRYVRDICRVLSKESKREFLDKELQTLLTDKFSDHYWLWESRASNKTRQGGEKKASLARIINSIEAVKELGFIVMTESKGDQEDEPGKYRLSYDGKLLAKCADKEINKISPDSLNERTSAFLSAYILKLSVIEMAIDVLSQSSKKMPLGKCKCSNCSYSESALGKIRKLKNKNDKYSCPVCNNAIQLGLQQRLEFTRKFGGKNCWWPLKFTEELDIFKFTKVSNTDYIELID